MLKIWEGDYEVSRTGKREVSHPEAESHSNISDKTLKAITMTQ